MSMQQCPHNQRARKPLEIPIGYELNESSGRRFVSPRTMYQIRLEILRRLSARIRAEFPDSSNESFSPGVG
jgi:hypothetical protein